MSAPIDVMADLRRELADAVCHRDEIAARLKCRFPRGFDGNGVSGDFEGLEMDWQDACREVRELRALIVGVQGGAA